MELDKERGSSGMMTNNDKGNEVITILQFSMLAQLVDAPFKGRWNLKSKARSMVSRALDRTGSIYAKYFLLPVA